MQSATDLAGTNAVPLSNDSLDVNWSVVWDAIAAAVPDSIAIVAGDLRMTYRELEDQASKLAQALSDRGIGAGDKVACYLYNRPEYLVALYAAMKLGAVPVNVNFRYREAELAALLTMSESRALVYPTSLGDNLRGAVTSLTTPPMLIAISDDDAAPVAGSSAFRELTSGNRLQGPHATSGDDQIFMFTGGTTGLPKAVIWAHGQLLDSQLYSAYGPLGIDFPRSVAEIVAIAVDPEMLHPTTLPITPLMHASALFNTMNALLLGGTVVFLGAARFDAGDAVRLIREHRISHMIIAGNAVATPLIEALDRDDAAGTPIDVSSIQTIISSGMVWSDACKRALLTHFDAHLFDVVGSSEGGPFAYSSVWSVADLPSRLRLAAGAAVLDEAGKELDAGVGVLAYRGAAPLGYFNDPVKTAAVYRQIGAYRYVVPGDWVRLLPANEIEFLGRGSAVVNTGGEKVYPAEVEEALQSHPLVADAVVFGIPDERWGEVVAAAVALQPDAATTTAELLDHIDSRLAGYKKPRQLVIGPIERSSTGKVDLVALTDRAIDARAQARHTQEKEQHVR